MAGTVLAGSFADCVAFSLRCPEILPSLRAWAGDMVVGGIGIVFVAAAAAAGFDFIEAAVLRSVAAFMLPPMLACSLWMSDWTCLQACLAGVFSLGRSLAHRSVWILNARAAHASPPTVLSTPSAAPYTRAAVR